jgi:uncharacterized membrane protein YkvA (DUF1232 family)
MKTFLIVVLAGAYICSPIDILPEALLGPFGLPDDIIALLAAIGAVRGGPKLEAKP